MLSHIFHRQSGIDVTFFHLNNLTSTTLPLLFDFLQLTGTDDKQKMVQQVTNSIVKELLSLKKDKEDRSLYIVLYPNGRNTESNTHIWKVYCAALTPTELEEILTPYSFIEYDEKYKVLLDRVELSPDVDESIEYYSGLTLIAKFVSDKEAQIVNTKLMGQLMLNLAQLKAQYAHDNRNLSVILDKLERSNILDEETILRSKQNENYFKIQDMVDNELVSHLKKELDPFVQYCDLEIERILQKLPQSGDFDLSIVTDKSLGGDCVYTIEDREYLLFMSIHVNGELVHSLRGTSKGNKIPFMNGGSRLRVRSISPAMTEVENPVIH